MWPNPQETVDLVTSTEEILNGKFCTVKISFFYLNLPNLHNWFTKNLIFVGNIYLQHTKTENFNIEHYRDFWKSIIINIKYQKSGNFITCVFITKTDNKLMEYGNRIAVFHSITVAFQRQSPHVFYTKRCS